MVAGAHALSELPDEITTPGRGQIRAMVVNCGNPVVSGRESHRHAHWLLPAVHWLERERLLTFTAAGTTSRTCTTGRARSNRRPVRVKSGASSSTWRSRCVGRCSAPRASTGSSRRPVASPASPVDRGWRAARTGSIGWWWRRHEVRVFSPVGAIELAASVGDWPRRGVVVIHGWGSRVFDPRGPSAGVVWGEPQPVGRRRIGGSAVADLDVEFGVRRRRARLDPRALGAEVVDVLHRFP